MSFIDSLSKLDNLPLTPKQIEFIVHANKPYNLADGSVRSGKTVGVLFRFMQAIYECPGDQIWMIGHTLDSVYHNCIRLLLDDSSDNPLKIFTPYVTWRASGVLIFAGKNVHCLGARDERALGVIQGKVFDLCYCNEMTLYPDSVIEMISSRLSREYSRLYADMNPVYPSHPCHRWIEIAQSGDPNYYSLHFTIDDNTFLPQRFKDTLKQTLTGLFFRRYYLGEWCLADGAVFDFFDRKIHVDKQKKPVDKWIAGIDYGASNAFACVIVGVKYPRYENDFAYAQVQAEYYYDPKGTRTKTNSEYARDIAQLFERYPVSEVYLDPSAASFKAELRKSGIPCMDADNSVLPGITLMTSLISDGEVSIYEGCGNLIREIEGYCWDANAAKKGFDQPLKQNDHACVIGSTLVRLADGQEIAIKDLSSLPQDKLTVLSCNMGSFTMERDLSTSSHLTQKNADIYELELESGKILEGTGEHLILTSRGYKPLKDLTECERVYTYTTSTLTVKSSVEECVLEKVKLVKKTDRKEDVYCLATVKNKNFIANGIVIKNCDALRYALKSHLKNRTSFKVKYLSPHDPNFGKSLGQIKQNTNPWESPQGQWRLGSQ